MKIKNTLLVLSFSLTLPNAAFTVHAADVSPMISLFPSTVRQDLKESITAVNGLNESLKPIIEQMKNTKEQFMASHCDGASADSGCAQIKRNMQQQYVDMLTEVDAILPKVEKSIRATHKSLSKSISRTYGKTKTPYQLQKDFLQQNNAITTKVRRNKGNGFLNSLKGLQRMIGSKDNNTATALTDASNFFLEANDAIGIIANARSTIAQAKVKAVFDLEIGGISEEMYATVAGIRGILDGDDDSNEINDNDTIIDDSSKEFDDSDLAF
jgi:hypothetical protein